MGRTIISNDGCFEWDEDKANANWKKHGIAFLEVLPVFFDSARVEFCDETHSNEEDRYITIGNAIRNDIMLVVVCSTERCGRVRLISARLASKREEGVYYGR
ncbi:MAG: BrnT family toxin [Sphaerochaetaceae bacterium]